MVRIKHSHSTGMYRNQYKNSTSVVLFEEPIESYSDFFIHMDMIHVQRNRGITCTW